MHSRTIFKPAFTSVRPREYRCFIVQATDSPHDFSDRDKNSINLSRRSSVLTGLTVLPSLIVGRPSKAESSNPERTTLNIKSLNSFQRKAERAAFLKLVEGELKKGLSLEDAPDTVRLVLHDAGTYDVTTGTGGLNGSIVQSEELNRPENASLKPIVNKLKGIKAEIDAKSTKAGFGPISWADLEVVAAKVANESNWSAIKRAKGIPSSGDMIATAFGAAWPVKLGRVDSGKPDSPSKVPAPEASVEEITDFFARLNNRNYGDTGFFAPKPIFDKRQAFVLYTTAQADAEAAEAKLMADPGYTGFKTKYDRSKATVTRTDYEVDFIDYFTQLASLGCTFNPDAYLVPIEIDTPRF